MTYDGLAIPASIVREGLRLAILRAAWLETFHITEIAEFLYRNRGWPSEQAAAEGARIWLLEGMRQGWIKPLAPKDGFYRVEGIGPIPVKRRALI